MPKTTPQSNQTFYFIKTDEKLPQLKPSLHDDMIRMYQLDDLANALARTKADGSKGVKLRKSYKSHIADLPGKHTIPTEDKSFTHIALMPDNPDFTKPKIELFSDEYLDKVINFEKTGSNGIPGFDSNKLSLTTIDPADLKKEREKKRKLNVTSPPDQQQIQQPELKKRHVQVKFD
ncbi:Rox3 protein [Pichia kluyveri]|uniref:Mediator of RNA polymerase II transcription subunit 19 n=1 Tax=Pichia kluyveri TaxID=36015 RepID=A0AAV5R0J8_PICKL|nr:Rox3 protein [Pichia kluyveri]